jgi:hypothetical protein
LTLTGARLKDAGSYDVMVTNTCGDATSNGAALTVEEAPEIVTQPPGQTTCPGAGVTFNVAANGLAPLSYQWRHDGAPIGGATGASYTLDRILASDAGAYDCVVTNPCGSTMSDAALLEFGECFHRGDPDASGDIVISDGIAIFNFLFLGGTAPLCRESADVNNSGDIDISDGIALLNFLFLGGVRPAPPGPTGSPCGFDPDPPGSPAHLGCATYSRC